VASSPAVVDGTVYVGSSDHRVYAIDATSGTEQWHFQTNESVQSSPAVVNGTVYVGSLDQHVYAIDATSGTEQWRFQTEGQVESSPTVVDSTVYVGSDENVYALDTASGNQRWAFETDDWMKESSPAVIDSTVYIGSQSGHFYALDAVNGNQHCSFGTDLPHGWMRSSPAVVDSTVYVCWRKHLYALDANSGTVQWCFEIDRSSWSSSPVVMDNTVYVGTYSGRIYALEDTGTEASNNEGDQAEPHTKVYEKCSNCDADLSEYDNLNFCPECGVGQ
jgi:outer membrane protein assembly factor BamB